MCRDTAQNVDATPLLVARGSVGMSGIKLFQNAGSVQEIVHQRIDRDHLTAPLKPVGSGA